MRVTGSLTIKRGKYYIVLNYVDQNGKAQRPWFSTGLPEKGNKRRAEDLLRDKIKQFEAAPVDVSKNQPFIDFILFWLEAVKYSIEPNTYDSYKETIDRYVVPYFCQRKARLQDLTPAMIQQMYNHYMDKGLSATSVLHIHANVRKALQYAVAQDMIPYNPADRVQKPKRQRYNAEFYTNEEISQLLDCIRDEPMYPVVFLAAYYGLRRSEVLGLQWRNVNLENGTLTVCCTVVECAEVYYKDNRTKTKSSNRTLPLTAEITEYLRQLKRRQAEDRLYFGQTYVQNDYVCKREDGTLFRPNYVTERFYHLLKKHGLRHIRFHDLRHSCASLLLACSFSLKEIQEWLGHGDIGTTANIYAHLQYESKKAMADTLAEKLRPQGECEAG